MPIRALGAVLALALAASASAQPTAFTYQGRLKNGAQPAAGLHDFRFRLWDAASGGAQLGTTQCVNNVPVAEGLFTAPIDFGPQFATTSPRFLEIEVRADIGLDCATIGGFVVLAPRQALTPAPVAGHAGSAFSLAASDGAPTNAVIVDSAGNVGIGTGAPTANLQINGPVPAIVLQDTSGTQQGYLELVDSGGVAQGYFGFGSSSSPHSTIWNRRLGGAIQFGTQDQDRMLISGTGNVGIGTTSPTAKLDVRGSIKLGTAGQYSALGGQEDLRMIRGDIDGNGTISRGTGFTVTRSGEGVYDVTFVPAFSGIPTVSATAVIGTGSPRWATSAEFFLSASTARIVMVTGGSPTDSDWSLIVVGPR
jgi:hypothetical protein